MANIYPFRALRPQNSLAHEISELPYDVVTRDEAKAAALNNPKSFFNISRPEICLPDETDPYSPEVYETGRKNLDRYIKDNLFYQDSKPCLYIYTLIMDGREQTGLVSCFSIDDYADGTIKKHELTLEAKELDRTRHLSALNANSGLVFLFYKNNGSKKHLFEKAMDKKPDYDFVTPDGIRHVVRTVDDEGIIAGFVSSFSGESLFIADGHHRAASAVSVGMARRRENANHTGSEEYNRFLAVAFPHDQLKIYPYNRVVKDLNGMAGEEFFAKISGRFIVEKNGPALPAQKHHISMYMDRAWHRLVYTGAMGASLTGNLDVSILQKEILEPALNIMDQRKDSRISFMGGVDGTGELMKAVDSGRYRAAFSMYPTSTEELMAVSNNGEIMPPKSTWFEPKLRSGLFLHFLD